MSTSALSPIPETDARGRVLSYPQAVRDAAFAAWAFNYGQNMREVSKHLNVPEPTIYRWRAEDGWVRRLGQLAADDYPHVRAAGMHGLVMAARDCIAWMWRVARGDEKPDKARQLTCTVCLDRAGYGPSMRTKDADPPTFTHHQDEQTAQELLDQVARERAALRRPNQ